MRSTSQFQALNHAFTHSLIHTHTFTKIQASHNCTRFKTKQSRQQAAVLTHTVLPCTIHSQFKKTIIIKNGQLGRVNRFR